MGAKMWFPVDEATAASTAAVFVEWLRATGRAPDDDAAFADFAGLDAAAGVAANRLRYPGPREALVLRRGELRNAWSRDGLRQDQPPLPDDIATALRSGSWHDLVASVAWHLFDAEIHPDDRLLWAGEPTDPWAFGALACGAAIILTDAPVDALPAIAIEENARTLRPPPSGRDAG